MELKMLETPVAEWPNQPLDTLIQSHCDSQPEKAAIVGKEGTITYGELGERSRRWANWLLANGVAAGTNVLVCIDRTIELPCILLGILRTGACYVPIDPALPADRVAIIVEDSGSEAVVAHRANLPLIPQELADHAFVVEDLPSAVEAQTLPQWQPDNLAYLLFTSGSTGRPKGVPIPRAAMVNFLFGMAENPGIKSDDRVLGLTTVSFDISVLEIYLPLVAGATLYLVSRNDGLDPGLLASFIEDNQLTLLQATPATWRMLVDYGWRPSDRHRILCGGEAFPVGLADTLTASASEVWNCYGPTEATVYASVHRIDRRDVENASIPLGDAVPNLVYRITDANGAQSRPGQPGELWIAGVGVTPGYYGRPELNADRFAEADHNGERLRFYRTGDLVNRTDDGQLLYIDRLDNQVKIRGFRVEIGEIETVLSSIPDVGESAVVMAKVAGGEAALVGCIRGDEPGDYRAIQSALAEKLPSYMVPKVWRWYPDLPVTPSRKIDRKALKAGIEAEAPAALEDSAAEFEDAATESMARHWQSLLGVRPDSDSTDFFALGGHSLLAARLSVLLQKESGKHIRPVDLLAKSRLSDHVDLLASAPVVNASDHVTLPDRVPFSRTQKRMWYAVLASKTPGTFYEAEAYSINGAINLDDLQTAIQQTLAAHVAFQMVIAEGEELEWRFEPPEDAVHTVSIEPESPDWQALPQTMSEEATRPFEFYNRPLVRFTIYTDHAERHMVQFVAHHMIIDGLSQTAVWKEIAERYRTLAAAARKESEATIEPDPEFARYLIRSAETASSDLDFWLDYLKEAPGPLDLKTDFPRPPVQEHTGVHVSLDLPQSVGDSLRQIARDMQATPFAVALSLYGLFLDKHAQQGSYVVGVPVNGRQPPVTQDTIGLFINTIALRVEIDQQERFDKLVGKISQSSLEAMQHDSVPFDEVVNALGVERDPSRMPVYQTMLGLNDYSERPAELADGAPWSPQVVETGFSQFDILLFVELYPNRVRLLLQGNTTLYKQSTLERFVRRFGNMLEQVVNAPDVYCDAIECATDDEQAKINEWSAPKSSYPRDSTVYECFQHQVTASPAQTAIQVGDKAISYEQLDSDAQRISQRLKANGVKTGDRVAISSRRTAESVAGILGILRAGASYVPLDLSYPDERLTSILDRTGAGVLLGDSDEVSSLKDRALSVEGMTLSEPDDLSVGTFDDQPADVQPEDGAYVMFTSGSTGQPKGIEVCHRNILRLVLNSNFMPLDQNTRFLMYAPVAFDASTLEIWGPLLNGGTLVIPEQEQISVEQLGEVLRNGKVTALWLTAALFHHVAEFAPESFGDVKYLLAGGDVLSPKWVRHMLATNPGLTLINGYGPTENTTFTCCYPMGSENEVPTPIPVGFPISNTSVHVLDAYGNQCPIGVPGKLFTSGDGVALGYINDPERTEKAFVTNPYGKSIGRVYDTGDLACWRPDGAIEFLGRTDTQVKIRGFRIEPDEISAVLEQFDGVEQAITVPWVAPSGEKQLVSYMTPVLKQESDRQDIKALLAAKLPHYMVPDYLVDMETFPVGATGKVDRKKLPEPDVQASAAGTIEKTPPATTTERKLAAIWEKVLNQTSVAREDNFFQLGGTSINALQVFSHIVREMKLDIPLSTLLEHPTLAGLAAVLDRNASPNTEGGAAAPANQSWNSLVPMGGEGLKHPIVCVHAVGGNVLSYRSTLETIGQSRPRVGFQSRGLDGHGEPKPTLHEQATDYVHELLAAGYQAPFTLMGGSMGGTIALEMASILESQGHEVDWVILLDTIGPKGREPSSDDDHADDEASPPLVTRIIQGVRSRAINYLKSGLIKAYRAMNAPVPYSLRPFFIETRNKQALFRHVEKPYAGNVLLIRGTEDFGGIYKDPHLGWDGVLNGTLKIELADVSHGEFMESDKVIRCLENFFSRQTVTASD